MRRLLIALMTATVATAGIFSLAGEKERAECRGLPNFLSPKYKVDPYIRCAAHIQAVGKEKGAKILLDLAKSEEHGSAVFVLCRMLFTPKKDGLFRRPLIGGPTFFGEGRLKDWPLEPIELVDDVPFMVVGQYFLAGSGETPLSYVQYCLRNCSWRSKRFKIPTKEVKQKALHKLLASKKWKTPLTAAEKDVLSLQIE